MRILSESLLSYIKENSAILQCDICRKEMGRVIKSKPMAQVMCRECVTHTFFAVSNSINKD